MSKRVEMLESLKEFSKAELAHLREKALAANVAIQAHSDFVAFLREQHEAPEEAGWQLAKDGFEKMARPQPKGFVAAESGDMEDRTQSGEKPLPAGELSPNGIPGSMPVLEGET